MNTKIRKISITQKMVDSFTVDEDKPWSQKTFLLSTLWENEEQHNFLPIKRENARIRINYEDEGNQIRVTNSLKIHIQNHSSCIQRIYKIQVFSQEGQIKKFVQQIFAEPYLYTLNDVIDVCERGKMKLPTVSSHYIISRLLSMYSYYLYLLNRYDGQLSDGIIYNCCLQNLAFNSKYKLILLNPCLVPKGVSECIKMPQKKVNMTFRHMIKDSLQKIGKFIDKFSSHGIIDFIESDKRKQIKISQEKEQFINHFMLSLNEKQEIPKDLFYFLKQRIETDQTNEWIKRCRENQENRIKNCAEKL